MIHWSDYDIGSSRAGCPECCKGKSDKSLGITIQADGSGIAHCFRCGYVEGYTPQGVSVPLQPTTPRPPAPQKRTVLANNWQDLWRRSQPLKGTLGEAYLTLRGCQLPPSGSHLRFMPDLKHPDGWSSPALLGLITEAKTRQAMSIHRTWIKEGTPKAIDRRLLGGHEKKGGVIRLWPDEYVTFGLAVAEGIETTLSLAKVYKPAWSLIDAGNMAVFPPLPCIENLVIGADHDSAGIKGANTLKEVWEASGREVLMHYPEQFEEDFNDMEKAA